MLMFCIKYFFENNGFRVNVFWPQKNFLILDFKQIEILYFLGTFFGQLNIPLCIRYQHRSKVVHRAP